MTPGQDTWSVNALDNGVACGCVYRCGEGVRPVLSIECERHRELRMHGVHTSAPRCYVAASWRTEHQPHVVAALRAGGVTCYDFRNPPNNSGFGWEEIAADWKSWTPHEYVQALTHPRAVEGFNADIQALRECYICVLVQPSGRSAALELGYAAGMGKRCAVLLAPGQEPELMLKVAEYMTDSLASLVQWARSLPGL